MAVGNRRLMEEVGVPISLAAAEFVRGGEGRGHTCIFVAAAGRFAILNMCCSHFTTLSKGTALWMEECNHCSELGFVWPHGTRRNTLAVAE